MSTDCNYYGIILKTSSTYCFVTPQKATRLEKSHRRKISKLYKDADEKKLFGEKKVLSLTSASVNVEVQAIRKVR